MIGTLQALEVMKIAARIGGKQLQILSSFYASMHNAHTAYSNIQSEAVCV